MKILAIGDLHGRTDWQQICKQNSCDKYIFLGDYFDSKEGITAKQQSENFKQLLEFKSHWPDKVVLLIGNHDYHYLKNVYQSFSGYQPNEYLNFQNLLQPAVENGIIQACFQYQNYLFSHAGITNTWLQNTLRSLRPDFEMLTDTLNELFRTKWQKFGFTPGIENDSSGDEPCQSPLWVRPKSLALDHVPGFIHVVGHTNMPNILIQDNLIFINTISTSSEFLIIENGNTVIRKLQNN